MRCFGRDQEIEAIWQMLKIDNNLLMLAPRRIGKTVILNKIQEQASEHGYNAVVVDVEGFFEERDFFRQCCSSIQEELSFGGKIMASLSAKLGSVFKNGNDSSDWRQILLTNDWNDFADGLFSHLTDENPDQKWLILVDELPVFVQTMANKGKVDSIAPFLYGLRRFRQKYKSVRWVFAGSIGLDTVAREFNVEGSLNDLHPIGVEPFSQEIADNFLEHICKKRGVSIASEAKHEIFKRLGWLSPYYLERITEDAAISCSGHIDLEEANKAMERLLDMHSRLYWSHWREHLDRNFPEPMRSNLYLLLNNVAKREKIKFEDLYSISYSANNNISSSDFRDQINTLVHDGYFKSENGEITFSMSLFREWWLRFVAI